MQDKTSLALKLTFSAVAALALFFIAELACRAVISAFYPGEMFSNRISSDYWEFRPDAEFEAPPSSGVFIKTNSMRLRDKDLKREKKTQEVRIYCAGNSTVTGYGIDFDKIFVQRLEKKLNSRGKGIYQVINGGVFGYTTLQSLYQFEEIGLKLGPDILVVANMNSDMITDALQYGSKIDDRHIRLKRLLSRSRLYAILYDTIKGRLLMNFLPNKIPVRLDPPAPRVAPDMYRANLEKYIELAEKNNIRIVFLVLPNPSDVLDLKELERFMKEREAEKIRFFNFGNFKNRKNIMELLMAYRKITRYCPLYRGIMKETAAAHNTTLVDIPALLQKMKHDGLLSKTPFIDEIHPDDYGHEIIAGALYEAVISKDNSNGEVSH